ncbi:hypothetical protein V8C40DRAFT_214640 [Trichoderma camerunense]
MTITQRKLTSASLPGSCVLGRPLTASGPRSDVICYRRRARDGHMTASTGPPSRLLQSITISLFQVCSCSRTSRAASNPTSHPPSTRPVNRGSTGSGSVSLLARTTLHPNCLPTHMLPLYLSGVELPEEVVATGPEK